MIEETYRYSPKDVLKQAKEQTPNFFKWLNAEFPEWKYSCRNWSMVMDKNKKEHPDLTKELKIPLAYIFSYSDAQDNIQLVPAFMIHDNYAESNSLLFYSVPHSSYRVVDRFKLFKFNEYTNKPYFNKFDLYTNAGYVEYNI